MLDSIEDLYWSNVEFANGFYNVTDPLDYLIEKQDRKDLIENLLKLPVNELSALMFVSYEENNFNSLAQEFKLSRFEAIKTYNSGLKNLRRKLKNCDGWNMGTI